MIWDRSHKSVLYCIAAMLTLFSVQTRSIATITAVWANDGEDKVTQDELRATQSPSSVLNSCWDGATISQFGGRNEVVSINIVLEAGTTSSTKVNVSLSNLTGPNGASIRSNQSRSQSQLFNWTTTEAELFYVRYLQITGLDSFGAGLYYGSEDQIPLKMRSPTAPVAGPWANRPNHDKYYPDIAVPLELAPNFTIAAGNNQSIWVDIYIPKTATAGRYSGTVTISEGGVTTHTLPVVLTVRNFTLPDMPSSKTMLFSSYDDISLRYTGVAYPNVGTSQDILTEQVLHNQRLLAHRHKISLIGDDGAQSGDSPGASYVPTLTGSLFTSSNGYAGPGVGVGNNVYSIGTYGSWNWPATQAGFQTNADAWESWFETNSPSTDRFVYLIDESSNYTQTQQWADWMKTDPGVGHKLPSLATINAPNAVASVPSLTIPTSTFSVGDSTAWQSAVNTIEADPSRQIYMYNGGQPAQGSLAEEAEGTSMREIPWGQYKKKINRWFIWEGTYYNDYQNGRGNNNLFHVAETFGGKTSANANYGQMGNNSSNGNGVFFYPGTDTIYPADSYNIAGPIASLRLKYWRRGIQDIDYISLANSVNPTAVTNIVNAVVPKVLWDNSCATLSDPTYYAPGVGYSWSPNPDTWEAQRSALANILDPQAGSTYVLWNNSGQAALWKIPAAGSITSAYFGPYSGWTPVALSSDASGNAYILWNSSSGATSVWIVAPSLTVSASATFGPYAGWTARSLGVGPQNDIKILWNGPGNQASLMTILTSTRYTSTLYGPYSGWQAQQIAIDSNYLTRMLWSNSSACEASLWSITTAGTVTSQTLGPFPGWQPEYLALGGDNLPRIAWSNTSSKQASVFTVAASGSVTSQALGPYSGWTPIGLAVNTDGDSDLMWNSTSNTVSLFDIGSAGIFTSSAYGPFSGWKAIAIATGP